MKLLPVGQASLAFTNTCLQATPVIAGAAIAAAAYAGKLSIEVFQKWKTAPPRLRQFYKVSLASACTDSFEVHSAEIMIYDSSIRGSTG